MSPDQRLSVRPDPGEQVITAVHPDLSVDIVQVCLDGRQRDEKFAGNVCIAFPLDDFPDNFPFPIGDPVSGKEIVRKLGYGHCGNGVMEEIIDQENPIQGIRDGTE
jgi:hypothetical protein